MTKRSIAVSNLPGDASESKVVINFQKRNNGGGDVDKVLWNEKEGTAVVVFADPEGKDTSLAGLPVLASLHITRFNAKSVHKSSISD